MRSSSLELGLPMAAMAIGALELGEDEQGEWEREVSEACVKAARMASR